MPRPMREGSATIAVVWAWWGVRMLLGPPPARRALRPARRVDLDHQALIMGRILADAEASMSSLPASWVGRGLDVSSAASAVGEGGVPPQLWP
jgi:hypothetical protein